jgi:hypothetical protein
LAVDPATGALRGVPVAAGRFPATFTVTDSVGQTVTVSSALRIVPRLVGT